MTDDEGPVWKPRFVWEETVVQETTLENGVKIIMRLHFGEYDMVHFARWAMLHPSVRLVGN